jgi:hypothetical protein
MAAMHAFAFDDGIGKRSVRLDRRQLQVEQRLDYRVAHEPQLVRLARDTAGGGRGGQLQVWLDSAAGH